MKLPEGPVLAIGEAMVEMAPVDGLYRRGFAGDTFNTVWHLAQLSNRKTGFVTQVGADPVSDAFVTEVRDGGLEPGGIGRDTGRTMGLYLIELTGAERSFMYWRDQSAARGLADNKAWLSHAVRGAALIHISGITLAILPDEGRATLRQVLAEARENGAKVSFDPNMRPRLWPSMDVARQAVTDFLPITDIALPSFDDEADTWGDADPQATVARFVRAGVPEVVVKNGADAVVWNGGTAPTPPVNHIVDTTGAGDAFNAGYLSARLNGENVSAAVAQGQALSGRVIGHYGARLSKDQINRWIAEPQG